MCIRDRLRTADTSRAHNLLPCGSAPAALLRLRFQFENSKPPAQLGKQIAVAKTACTLGAQRKLRELAVCDGFDMSNSGMLPAGLTHHRRLSLLQYSAQTAGTLFLFVWKPALRHSSPSGFPFLSCFPGSGFLFEKIIITKKTAINIDTNGPRDPLIKIYRQVNAN